MMRPSDTDIVLDDIRMERIRHREIGYTTGHDDQHTTAQMAEFAHGYLNKAVTTPWTLSRQTRAALVKAAAVIVAAIERLDRQDAFLKETRS